MSHGLRSLPLIAKSDQITSLSRWPTPASHLVFAGNEIVVLYPPFLSDVLRSIQFLVCTIALHREWVSGTARYSRDTNSRATMEKEQSHTKRYSDSQAFQSLITRSGGLCE